MTANDTGLSRLNRDTGVRGRLTLLALFVGAASVFVPRDAAACGACYALNNESTIVNDHRMALSISKQRTILWDQIQYSGNPKDFAYVLPAKPGTKLEPSTDAWFTALDASTRPIIMPPPLPAYTGGGDDEGGGCCGSSDDEATFAGAGGNAQSPPESVQVIDQAVVGPYETVTLRSTDPLALQNWLVDHGYAIPEISAPIIASYVQNGFDFIALRMQPSQSERQIEPIRIVAPGPDNTLPLRLMQIGAGAKVGITLYVFGEGRYQPSNFPEGPVDFTKLAWDNSQNRSNYQELLLAAMDGSGGRAGVTEYAKKPTFLDFPAGGPSTGAPPFGNPTILTAYKQACAPQNLQPTFDAGGDPTDSGGSSLDASSTDAATDAAVDASDGGGDGENTGDAGSHPKPKVNESRCDDLTIATEGMALDDVWLTRIRFNLPTAALADELRLEPAKQEPVDNVHQTTRYAPIKTATLGTRRVRWHHETAVLVLGTAMALSRLMRRKRT